MCALHSALSFHPDRAALDFLKAVNLNNSSLTLKQSQTRPAPIRSNFPSLLLPVSLNEEIQSFPYPFSALFPHPNLFVFAKASALACASRALSNSIKGLKT
jgi:hypothetical protein